MTVDGIIDGCRRGNCEKGLKPVSKRQMSGLTRDGTGRPNLSREAKFSGANGTRKKSLSLSRPP